MNGTNAIVDNNMQVPTNSSVGMWVHQTDWQKNLLVHYGNTISLIDATYKTTKYELDLFFICVQTNIGYSIAGKFIVQSEITREHLKRIGSTCTEGVLFKS